MPAIDVHKCRYCGLCSGYCAQNAIRFNRLVPSVNLIVSRCMGCGICSTGCHREGIRMKEKLSGRLWQGRIGEHYFIAGQTDTDSGFQMPLLHALLHRLRPEATVICDFGPVNGMQVCSGLKKMDLAVLVLWPSGDWERKLDSMFEMLADFDIPAGVILDKADEKDSFLHEAKAYCYSRSIPVFGVIPLDAGIESESTSGKRKPEANQDAVFMEMWKEMGQLIAASVSAPKDTIK